MNRKHIGILIIILGLAVIALILYFLFFFDFNKQNNPIENNNQTEIEKNNILPNSNTNNTNSTIVEVNEALSVKRELNENDLIKIASSFAERFGSYSNHSNFGNIRDLKIFMTKKMQAWADNFIANQTKGAYSDIYYGVTTKSISTEVKNFDKESGVASILVNTQKRESTGSTNNTSTFYQDILISFVKENNSWKVDGANWLNNKN